MYLFKLEFSSFLDIHPGVGLLDHRAALCVSAFLDTELMAVVTVLTEEFLQTESSHTHAPAHSCA